MCDLVQEKAQPLDTCFSLLFHLTLPPYFLLFPFFSPCRLCFSSSVCLQSDRLIASTCSAAATCFPGVAAAVAASHLTQPNKRTHQNDNSSCFIFIPALLWRKRRTLWFWHHLTSICCGGRSSNIFIVGCLAGICPKTPLCSRLCGGDGSERGSAHCSDKVRVNVEEVRLMQNSSITDIQPQMWLIALNGMRKFIKSGLRLLKTILFVLFFFS